MFTIREQNRNPMVIEPKVKIKESQMSAIVDTGVSYSYITKEIIDKLNISFIKLIRKSEVEMGNGGSVLVEDVASYMLQIDNDVNVEYNVDNLILPTMASEILL